MSPTLRSAAAVFASALSMASLCRADYLDDTGYRALAAELGTALPTGQGVPVTQVEAVESEAGAYSPEGGSGAFTAVNPFLSGVSLTVKSGATATSGHAFVVAAHFYGRNQDTSLGRAGFCPGVTVADIYRVGEDDGSDTGSWLSDAFLTPGSAPPLIEIRAVQNHSWISGDPTPSRASIHKALLRRFDFAIRRDGFLAVTGVNNGSNTVVPSLMVSAYNNLSVGVSSGNHSRGGVSALMDGGGRQKPEIVAPLDYTSFSTGLVSSAGAFLRQTADAQGPDARLPQTIKAILLAGATKEEFPGWTRTPEAPLDPIFGAGELHLGNSWHILAGGEQVADATTPVPDQAWSLVTPATSRTYDFPLTLAPGETGLVFSAMAVWNRIVANSNPGGGFTAAVAQLADCTLALERLSGDGGASTVMDRSISSIENLEHIYQRDLPSGHYRLRLSLVSGTGVPVALAWRLHRGLDRPQVSLERAGGQDTLVFAGLVTGQRYLIQRSDTLAEWETAHDFTAEGTTLTWPVAPAESRGFYRLAAADAVVAAVPE